MSKSRSGIPWKDMAEVSYRLARLFRALSNPKALAACELLLEGEEFEPRELARLLRRDLTTVSRILRDLRQLNVVRYQKTASGTWYTIKHPEEFAALLASGKRFIRHSEEDLDTET
jgi:predicted transcriptional regulator